MASRLVKSFHNELTARDIEVMSLQRLAHKKNIVIKAALFTLYRIAFAPPRKPLGIGIFCSHTRTVVAARFL